jgi:hypothetical protein
MIAARMTVGWPRPWWLAVAAVILTGCGGSGALRRDLEVLLRQHGCNAPVTATQSARSRGGRGEFLADATQIAGLVRGLKLTVAGPDDPLVRAVRLEHRQAGMPAAESGPVVQVYVSSRRAPELRLLQGAAFEYFVLYYLPANRRAIVWVSYAYG